MTENIKLFCQKPHRDTLMLLSEEAKKLFYKIAKEVVAKEFGNITLAKQVIEFMENNRYVCLDKCTKIKKNNELQFGTEEGKKWYQFWK